MMNIDLGTCARPEKPPNQGLDLTNPDAAQSVAGAPLCLLSGLAAQAHVRRATDGPKAVHSAMKWKRSVSRR